MQVLYRLRGLEGALRGMEFDLVHPFEPIRAIIKNFQPDKAAPLPNWLAYHRAFLLEQALGANALLAAQPGRLKLEPYQLVPALRAIRMARPRLMLADGVGLGKTIQAALVTVELIARRLVHRILIVSPAGPLLEQWKTEMSERFGLRFEVIDRAKIEEVRKSQELGANPFDHLPLGLSSIDFLKQERILEILERSSYDLVIIDEVHHCTDLGAIGTREDTQRRRLAQVLARKSDSLLLLSATPHDGNDRSFASLCELLDPSLVDGKGNLREGRYKAHVVRRLKKHIKDPVTGEPLFKDRKVIPIPVTLNKERHARVGEMHRSLIDLLAPELRRAVRAKRYNDVLSFITLLKRSVSTVAACASTLQVVSSRFGKILSEGAEAQESRRQRLQTLRDYRRKLDRYGVVSPDEEKEFFDIEVEDLAQQFAGLQREVKSGSYRLKRTADVVDALDDLVRITEEALADDPKLECLVTEVRKIRQQEPGTNILVYTEYTDSQAVAAKALRKAGVGEILTLSGEDEEGDRIKITTRFRLDDNLVLVSTDTAAEGLNLHERCHNLIHLELPFNPNRLEQRNGRIDRYGQKVEPVVRYFFLQGTFEGRILARLIAKYERQRARLTFVPNTLGISATNEVVAEQLLKGLFEEEERLFKDPGITYEFGKSDENEGADEATKDLLSEIDRVVNGYDKATKVHSWLGETGLNAENALMTEAGKALDQGDRIGAVDLATFVIDAVLLDGGRVKGSRKDKVFEVSPPPSWVHGLGGLPGADPIAGVIRLTTDAGYLRDEEKRPVGFLGRAHPLTRKAIERVRHLSFGADGGFVQDVRVSAVSAKVDRPELLFTFLGRVMSKAGREFERVLAVRVPKDGPPEFLESPESWLPLAEKSHAITTTGIWEKQFSGWGTRAKTVAADAAVNGFSPIAEKFSGEYRSRLEGDRKGTEDWLRARATEITGKDSAQQAQLGLFRSGDSAQAEYGTPEEQIASIASDPSNPSALRSEADGVIRLYKQRFADQETRRSLANPEIVPLGVLMIIPEAGHVV